MRNLRWRGCVTRHSFFAFFLFCQALGAEHKLQHYLEFLNNHKYSVESPGSYKNGEIEIVKDEKSIKEIEDLMLARLLKEGHSRNMAEEASRIGILQEDPYWLWVRDGVIFPTGARGTYNRIIWKREITDEVPRVAILPVLPNGKIVLNLNYRHALRKWVLEIPRGYKRFHESNEDAVKRQLKEETGYTIASLSQLGSVSPDSGSLSASMPIYYALLGSRALSNQDYTEAILRLEEFSLEDLKKIYAEGSIMLEINKKIEPVAVCDAYLAYAILQAENKGIFSQRKSGN